MAPDSTTLEVSGPGVSLVHPLSEGRTSLGRAPQNDLVLDHELVSRHHAVFTNTDGVAVTDLGSSNGTLVNGARIPVQTPQSLHDGDVVTIEPFTLIVRLPLAPIDMRTTLNVAIGDATAISVPGRALAGSAAPPPRPVAPPPVAPPPARPNAQTIGRSPDSDLWIDDPLVSRRHARLLFDASGRAVIEDLGSSNGTFVDSARVAPGQRLPLVNGANVYLGNTHLVFNGTTLVPATADKSVRLEATNLKKVTSKGANLLQDITISIQPKEFVVIVGPSGAGKSTLLGALSGLWPATDGRVYVNGVDLYENFDALRTNIGYVPQDDIIHRELPVRASLDYAAQLRLPADTTPAEREARVTSVIQTLGLQERQDVPVGSLSGGQRKRVSIGVELLTSPGLFFLDEATSGLDPGTEAQMMRMLRGLADDGHTILLVTHATKNVALCDQVVFLARGGYLAFYGPPEEALTYFGVDDFDGIYEKLDGEMTPQDWGSRFRQSKLYDSQIRQRLQQGPRPDAAQGMSKAGTVATSPRFGSQLSVLSRRYLDIIRRDRVNLAMMMLIAPVLGAVDLLAWPRYILDPVEGDLRRALTMLFLSSLVPFLVGAMMTIREVVKEGPIYRRERAAGLGVMPYVVSKVWVLAIFAVWAALCFVLIKIAKVDLQGLPLTNVLLLYVTVLLAVYSGMMWGLVLSAIVPREDRAMHLVAAIIVFQLVFSGGLLSLSKLGTAGTVLGAVTSVNWALRGSTAALEIDTQDCLGEAVMTCDLPGIQSLETPPERFVVINAIEQDFGDVLGSRVYTTWLGMAAIIGVLFVVFSILQKLKDRG